MCYDDAMKMTILCVGKLKEKFYREAVEEYCKRLSRYCKVEIIEVEDVPLAYCVGNTCRVRVKAAGDLA